MPDFVLVTTVFNLYFAIVWAKGSVFNVAIKMYFITTTVFGGYFLFGPTNLISKLTY